MTGGDPINARFLHREWFTYTPEYKIWLAVNHKPKVSDTTYSFWRRIRLIPFNAIFENENVTAQLIADGVHIHPSVLKLAFEILGPERIVLITDGMQAMGLPDGKYIYNGVEYESKEGAARYKDGTLIGTALGLSELLKRLISFTGCGLDVAVKTVTENPAKVLGLADRKASIAVGKDADLVLLNDDLSVQATIVGGRIVFEK